MCLLFLKLSQPLFLLNSSDNANFDFLVDSSKVLDPVLLDDILAKDAAVALIRPLHSEDIAHMRDLSSLMFHRDRGDVFLRFPAVVEPVKVHRAIASVNEVDANLI